MARYKVLKSVAHNLGDSFLSDTNLGRKRGVYIPELLRDTAVDSQEAEVWIDFLNLVVQPAVFSVRDVRESVAVYRKMLFRLIDSMGAAEEMVTQATLSLRFDLQQSDRALYKKPVFECEVVIRDDRGKDHVGRPQLWCF